MMKKLSCVLLALLLILAFAVTAGAESSSLTATDGAMCCYEGGYGATPARYRCDVNTGSASYFEWFEISYGDPLVAQWPTEAGTHTVTFTVNHKVGNGEYPFTVTLTLEILPLPATSGQCGDNMTWSFNTQTDTLTISGKGDMYTVAESSEAFQNGQFAYEPGWWYLPVRHVVVEEGVEHLSNYAFFQSWNNYYTIHETISLPTTLKAIPQEGFLCSTAMKSLTIPEGITSLTGWPFGSPGNSFTALEELCLPSTLKQLDPVTVILGGLDNRSAQPTLTTLRFAGSAKQWARLELVESPLFETLFAEDYQGFRDNWIVPATERFHALDVLFEPTENLFDITIDSPITMSQIYGTLLNHQDGAKIVYLDWNYAGLVDATVAGKAHTGITTEALATLIRDAYPHIMSVEWQEGSQQLLTPWTVGQPNDCCLVLRVMNAEDVLIPCQVVITETKIASVSASSVSYYCHEGWKTPTFTVTYKDGTTGELPRGILVSYPEGMPSQPGSYTVKIVVGCILQTQAEVTVLPTPATGKLGENITWTYDEATETLTLSGTGKTYDTLDDGWMDLLMELAPRHILVEKGIEALTPGIFYYGMSVETLKLPATLQEIPDALIGWNGMPEDVIDGYVMRTMSAIAIPEGITALTSSAFYGCLGISDFYLPSTLREIDLDTLCYVAAGRASAGMEPLTTTIHFAGTEAQWAQIAHVTGSRTFPTGLSDAQLEALFATFTLVFEPRTTVNNGVATVPDNEVTVPETGDTVIDVTEFPAHSVVLSGTTLDKLLHSGTGLQVKLPEASLSFDRDALSAFGGESGVTLMAKADSLETLTPAQKEALKAEKTAVLLTLEAFAGEAQVTDFGTGKVTVSIPFTPTQGKNSLDYYVAYLAEDGTLTPVEAAYADGMYSFETNHFSTYAVLQVATAEDDNPNTGDARWALLALMLAAGFVCLSIRTRRFA